MMDAGLDPTSAKNAQPVAPGAVAAIVWGILGLFLFGLITGWVAINNAREAFAAIDEDPRLGGRKLAMVGFALGIVDIVGWCTVLTVILAKGVDA